MTTKYLVKHLGLADASYISQNHPDSLQELREKGYRGSIFVFLDVEPIPGAISPPVKSYQRAIANAISKAAQAPVPRDEFDQREYDLDDATEALMQRHQSRAGGLASKVNNPVTRLLTGPVDYKEGQIIDFPIPSAVLNKNWQWYADRQIA